MRSTIRVPLDACHYYACRLHGRGTNKPQYVRPTFRLRSAYVPPTIHSRAATAEVYQTSYLSAKAKLYAFHSMMRSTICVPLYACHYDAFQLHGNRTSKPPYARSTFRLRSVYVPPTMHSRAATPHSIKPCISNPRCMRSTILRVPLYAFHYMCSTIMRANHTDAARTSLPTFRLRSVYAPLTFRSRSARDPLMCCDRRILSNNSFHMKSKARCVPLQYAFHCMRSAICVPLVCVPITRILHRQNSLRSVYVPSTFRPRSAYVPPAIHSRAATTAFYQIFHIHKQSKLYAPPCIMRSTIRVPPYACHYYACR